jgi:hypothetical protein
VLSGVCCSVRVRAKHHRSLGWPANQAYFWKFHEITAVMKNNSFKQ